MKLLVHELNEKTKLLEQVVGEKHSLESHMRDVGLGHLVGNSRPPSPYRRRPHTAAAKFKSRTQQLKKQQVKDISISDLELYSDGHNWTNESSPIRIIPSEEFLESHRLAGRRESELLLEAESRGYNEGQTVDFLAKYRRWSVQFNNAPEVSYDMPSSPGSRRSSGMHHHHYNRQSLASNTPEKPKHGATLQVYEPRPSMKIDREVSQEDQKQQQFETLEKERRYTTRIRPATAMPDSSFSSSRKLMPNSSVLQFALPDVSKSVPTSKSVTRAQSAAIKSRINSISTTSMSTRINSAATTASTAAGHSSLSIIRAQSAATTSMAQSAVSSLRIQSAASHPKSSIGIPNILRLKEQIPSSTK